MINYNGQFESITPPSVLGFRVQYEEPEPRLGEPCKQEYDQPNHTWDRTLPILQQRRDRTKLNQVFSPTGEFNEAIGTVTSRKVDELTNSRYGIEDPNALSVVLPHLPTREAKTVWDILESLIGTIDGPIDWAAEHDHYLYGTPKRDETVL